MRLELSSGKALKVRTRPVFVFFHHIIIALVIKFLLTIGMLDSKSGIGEHGFPVDEELQADIDFFITDDPSLAIVDTIRTSLEALTFETPSPSENAACKPFAENKTAIILRISHSCLCQELWEYIGIEDRNLQEKLSRSDILRDRERWHRGCWYLSLILWSRIVCGYNFSSTAEMLEYVKRRFSDEDGAALNTSSALRRIGCVYRVIGTVYEIKEFFLKTSLYSSFFWKKKALQISISMTIRRCLML